MLLLNVGINVLCGVGILSTPYAVKQGGWLGLSILLIFAILSYYTGILLRYCLDSQPGLETYPDIGQAAFGTVGRVAISVFLNPFTPFKLKRRQNVVCILQTLIFCSLGFCSADNFVHRVVCKYISVTQQFISDN